MKRFALAVAPLLAAGLAFALAAAPAGAQGVQVTNDEPVGFYVGAGIADANVSIYDDYGCWYYYCSGASRDGESDTGLTLAAGWRINSWVAVEAQYVDAGNPRWDDFLVYVPDLNGTYNVAADLDVQATEVTVLGILPLGRWDIYLRAGAAYVDAKSVQHLLNVNTNRTTTRTVTDTGTEFVIGFGGGVTFADRVRLRLEFQEIGLDRDLLAESVGDASVYVVDLQLQYRFGN